VRLVRRVVQSWVTGSESDLFRLHPAVFGALMHRACRCGCLSSVSRPFVLSSMFVVVVSAVAAVLKMCTQTKPKQRLPTKPHNALPCRCPVRSTHAMAGVRGRLAGPGGCAGAGCKRTLQCREWETRGHKQKKEARPTHNGNVRKTRAPIWAADRRPSRRRMVAEPPRQELRGPIYRPNNASQRVVRGNSPPYLAQMPSLKAT
jgi:hypothetical protein